jgi:hypothetical protein
LGRFVGVDSGGQYVGACRHHGHSIASVIRRPPAGNERVAVASQPVELASELVDPVGSRVRTPIAGVRGETDELDHDLAGMGIVDAREHGPTQRRFDRCP